MNLRLPVFLGTTLVLLAGCTAADRPAAVKTTAAVARAAGESPEAARERREAYLAAHPELPAATAAAIRAGELREGMNFNEVSAILGDPLSYSESRARDGHWERWNFRPTQAGAVRPRELVFFNGGLVRWSE